SVRKHWSVENNLHWQLDVSFNEDYGRKKNNAAVNFSLVSKTALSMLKHYESKSSIARKRKSAGWSDDVLQSILSVDKF
ncbi:MAG: transposase, partial [Macellibacteroides fermentans]|uniref:transposase n=2 Tax=Bacteroidales TaxID=171549 RepID=UPI003AC15615